MGNQPISSFQEATWKQVESKGGVRIILQNEQNLNSVQKYLTTFQAAQIPLPQHIYKWRTQISPEWHVVQVYQYGLKRGGICNGFDQYYVITERCYRLNQIPHFSKPQAFLIIKQTIIAIKKLSQKYGLFSPNIHKIGINQQGQVRLWINQNYASNSLQDDLQGHPKLEQAVVNNLCRLIKNRVYNNQMKGQYPFHMNFNKAIKYITEYMKNDRNFMVDKIYKDRENFTKEYSAKRQQFSRTRSRQLFSQFSRGSKINEDCSFLNISKQEHNSKQILSRDLNDQVIPSKRLNAKTSINKRGCQNFSYDTKNSFIHNQSFQKIINHQRYQNQIFKFNNNQNNEKVSNNSNFLKNIIVEMPAQRRFFTKIQEYKKNSDIIQYDKYNNINRVAMNKINKVYLPKPIYSRDNLSKNKTNFISQKSQIRIQNNLQQVNSQVLVQDNQDSLLDEVRDNVPFN